MPNLTSYRPPATHLHRELPKSYCDLIRHEIDYSHFVRTRLANVQSSFSSKEFRKRMVSTRQWTQRKYYDHQQRLQQIYRENVKLCEKIRQIWNNYPSQNGAISCQNENHGKYHHISHFRLRQNRWKERVERENHRLIRALV